MFANSKATLGLYRFSRLPKTARGWEPVHAATESHLPRAQKEGRVLNFVYFLSLFRQLTQR